MPSKLRCFYSTRSLCHKHKSLARISRRVDSSTVIGTMDSQQKNQILKELYDLLFEKHINLTRNSISQHFQIHISDAEKVLEEFAGKHRKDKRLAVQYLLSGHDNSEEGQIPLQRFSIVDENELDAAQAAFTNSTCTVYSINLVEHEPKYALNFEHFICEPTRENLSRIQSLTYIHNPHIKSRPVRRPECLKPTIKYDSFTHGEKKKEVTNDIKHESMDVANDDIPKPATPKSIQKPASPKKRACSSNEAKRYKRIRVLDSDDDDGDEEDVKENVKTENEDGFKVTKLENKPNEKPLKNSPIDEKKKVDSKPKSAQQSNNTSVPKVPKIQTQTSITNFFKRPPPKK